jgi:hypothetical protein
MVAQGQSASLAIVGYIPSRWHLKNAMACIIAPPTSSLLPRTLPALQFPRSTALLHLPNPNFQTSNVVDATYQSLALNLLNLKRGCFDLACQARISWTSFLVMSRAFPPVSTITHFNSLIGKRRQGFKNRRHNDLLSGQRRADAASILTMVLCGCPP